MSVATPEFCPDSGVAERGCLRSDPLQHHATGGRVESGRAVSPRRTTADHGDASDVVPEVARELGVSNQTVRNVAMRITSGQARRRNYVPSYH